ncbi:MAG TPA: insulinase family protein [Chitinophagales bacterium]|nr:insulinase family protein [Chitinophagales bacterium]
MKKQFSFLSVLLICLLFVQTIAAQTGSSSSQGSTNNPGTNTNKPPTTGSSSSSSSTAGSTNGGPIRVEPGTPDPITLFTSGNATAAKPGTPNPGKYSFITIPDDPTRTRIYKLNNGFTVYLSQNKAEPRIQTYIAVKAGSKNDPRETTGLAHYLEHMMFKGTSNVGTTNWSREKPIIDAIAQLYEQHRKEKDPEKKKEIYKKIDEMSQEAAKYAVPNEYDKMITSLGAKGTNAYTSKEQTVYVNDIPANELEKWLVIESERFSTCVLRLFHTELEAVYEEYNMGQDRDGSKMSEAYYRALFPTHPYGTQTTIGEGEHLKNPSMLNIMAYFYNFYVPSNMAICLSGDIDYDKTIELINKYFGTYVNRPIGEQKFLPEKPLQEVQRREVFGQEAETMMLGYRVSGAGTEETMLAKLFTGILYNGQAGLIDLDLNQQQKVLDAGAFLSEWKEYTVITFAADPREGQSLEECEQLLLAEIEKVKRGEFDEWLLKAVINDYKLSRIKSFESNSSRASAFVNTFVKGIDWGSYLNEHKAMESVTKQDIIDFANEFFGSNNYVVVYKRQGEDKNVKKVDKPAITPVEANREAQSAFLQKFMELPSLRVQPEFIDYEKRISNQTLGTNIPFSYIKNEENQLFELYYILDMGTNNDLYLPLAINYLPYLGTDKYSPSDLQKEFFKYGLSFNVFTSSDRVYVSLQGLESNLDKGVELFEHLLSSVKPDNKAYKELVNGIIKEREDNKSNKSAIFNSALATYARYGSYSPVTDILSEKDLNNTLPTTLTDKIKSLTNYKHRIFYYGALPQDQVITVLAKYHKAPETLAEYPVAKKYTEQSTKTNKVYFVNYNMVQAQVMFMAKDENFNKSLLPEARLFNEYFGSGLSSIVFQEIRETKALAYSAYANFTTPANKDEAHYVRAFVGTQADKMQSAIEAMMDIMNNMPQAEKQFNASIESVVKQIESERIIRSNIFWSYENAKRRGLTTDIRKDIYTNVTGMTLPDLQQFVNDHIADNTYTIIVMGDKTKLDMSYLQSIGEFKELTLEEIFGY